MSADQRVEELLLQWETAWRAGHAVTPEQLCPDCPEVQAELHRRIELLRKFEAFAVDNVPTAKYAEARSEATTHNYLDDEGPQPVIPGYVILGKLGVGGMGIVWRAWQEDLGLEVALKVIKAGPNIPPQVAGRFIREARLLAQLKHDNLVRVFDAKLHVGQPYFVMELVQGGNLSTAVPRFGIAPLAAVKLMEEVARVVHFLHEKGVLHRDLKPANILLDEHDRPRVCDFGLAKLLEDGPEDVATSGRLLGGNGLPTLSLSGAVMGTPQYMAPEQFDGDANHIKPQTDVWALGVILYELLTGQRPFVADRYGSYVASVCQSVPKPPRTIRPHIDWRLEPVILKCLEKNTAHRYETAAKLAAELAVWKAGGIPEACRASKARRTWHQVQRRPAVALALVMAPMLAIVVAVLSLRSQPARTLPVDPNLAIQAIEAALVKDESDVRLISTTGAPAWFRTVVGGDRTKTLLAADGTFTVVSGENLCLLELVNNPQRERYTLTARVRHEKGDKVGQVGIYCGRQEYACEGAEVHTLFYIAFDDVNSEITNYNHLPPAVRATLQPPTGNKVLFHFQLFGRRQDTVIADDVLYDRTRTNLFEPAGYDRGGWRTLVLKVSPNGVEAYWDGTVLIARMSTDLLPELTEDALNVKKVRPANLGGSREVYPSLARQGGLGLFVRNSTASFSSITIEK